MSVMLVIDDEPSILHAFRRAFQGRDVTVATADSAGQGLEALVREQPDLVVLDVNLPDMSGLAMYRRIVEVAPRTPVIFITGRGTTDTAIEAIKLGAFDYLLKPLELDHLREVVARALRTSRLMKVPALIASEPTGPTDRAEPGDAIVGRCPRMQEVYKLIGRVAPQDVTVLIEGESGTGKELVARAIYQHSRKSNGPFLAINCAAIPEPLLESELFGHEKGAFTGADRLRVGKFEQCSDGTLLLDEIGDMSPMTQTKILRVLQERQFERVGGNETIRTNCRLIAATNRDLEQMVAEGRFRADLFYRISVFKIHLPPLRDRGEDSPLLIDYFIKRYNAQLGKQVQTLTPAALELMKKYSWPGNVRELQSILMAAMLRATGPVLDVESLPAAITAHVPVTCDVPAEFWASFVEEQIASGRVDLYAQALEQMERQLIPAVLERTEGNQVQAARILGISRGSLRTKIRSLGIKLDRVIWSEDDQAD